MLGSLLLAAPAEATPLFGHPSGSQDTRLSLQGWTLHLGDTSVFDSQSTGAGTRIDSIESLIASAKGALFQLGGDWNLDFHSWSRWTERWCDYPPGPTSAVPEPTAALVFGAGLLIVGGAARRRR